MATDELAGYSTIKFLPFNTSYIILQQSHNTQTHTYRYIDAALTIKPCTGKHALTYNTYTCTMKPANANI